MSDVIIRITDFFTKSRSASKLIDKNSVKKVINSERFKVNLSMGRILGLATHKSRYEVDDQHIPLEDNILTSPYLANVAKRVWIDESKDCLMGEFDLLDTQYGRLIKDFLKKGIMIPVSMSVSATADNDKYYIDDLLGVDFTMRPDLNAAIEKVNFSEKDLPGDTVYEKDGKQYVSFSHLLTNEDIICNFSDDGVEIEQSICEDCGEPIDSCICSTTNSKGIRREGRCKCHSETMVARPKVTESEQKVDIEKAKPVPNTEVGSVEVLTNLDTNVSGEDTEDITPNEYFNTKLFNELGISSNDNLNVTLEDIHKDIPIEDQLSRQQLVELPNTMTTVVNETVSNNFSVQQYMAEMQMQPYAILFRRINEVIQLCRSKKQEWINDNIDKLKAYFDSYVLTWVNAALTNSNKEFNINLGLRLTKYNIDNKKMLNLNRIMKRMRKQLESTGWITKPIQQELNSAYQAIEDDIYKFIDDKIKPQGVTFFITEDE